MGDSLLVRLRRMLPTLSVERRCRLQCGYQIPIRIKLGMIFSTFEERAGDAVSIFGNSGTDLNCRRVLGVAHEKSIAWNSLWVCPQTDDPIVAGGRYTIARRQHRFA